MISRIVGSERVIKSFVFLPPYESVFSCLGAYSWNMLVGSEADDRGEGGSVVCHGALFYIASP